MSDHYGDLLIALMERYGARNLQEISNDQAKEFYFLLIKERKIKEVVTQ